jgi:hypothetical protein
MELKNVKLYVGPVTKNVVDTVIKLSKENYKIGLIPSRRQIDWDGGYVNNWTTESFFDYIGEDRKNIILERDHGGIGQGEYYDNGATSLYVDSKLFDIIHIDPFLNYKKFQQSLSEMIDNIKFINKINDKCLFEVSTEESILNINNETLSNILLTLDNKLGEIFKNNVKYCVIQSGTKLKGIKNIGNYDIKRLKKGLNVCEKYNLLSKEHNGDYLDINQIKTKFDTGLSAINIAPEFGVFETDILLENMTEYQKDKFFNVCYNSNKWVKWVDENFDPFKNKLELMRICGHYQFSTTDFLEMNINIDDIIQEKMYEKIKKICEL